MTGFLPENPGVLVMDIIAEIRRRFHVDNETVTSLAEAFKLSRPTIRKHLNTVETPVYQRQNQPHPKLGSFHDLLEAWLEQEAHFPRKQRRTAQRLYECLQVEGYRGSYTVVQRYVKRWKKKRASSPTIKQAFVPLAFPVGETCQFDWSQETVLLGGVAQTLKWLIFVCLTAVRCSWWPIRVKLRKWYWMRIAKPSPSLEVCRNAWCTIT